MYVVLNVFHCAKVHVYQPPFGLDFGFRGGFQSRPYDVSGGFGTFQGR
jgi:hypothetical protein